MKVRVLRIYMAFWAFIVIAAIVLGGFLAYKIAEHSRQHSFSEEAHPTQGQI